MRRAAFLLLGCLLVVATGCSRSGPVPLPPAADPISIRLEPADPPDGEAVFEVHGLEPEAVRIIQKELADPSTHQRLAVCVVTGEMALADHPSMLGALDLKDGVLRFTPRFPLERGVRYRAELLVDGLPNATGKVSAEFLLPRPERPATTLVEHVYPSSDTLPENELKFYLHFSSPMSRGEAYRRVHLVNSDGREVEGAFLELGEELWDSEGTRLTLLLDPGRIKRGLKPREEFGPALEEGKQYTLVVDREWPDADGMPLKEGHRKAFRVVAPDEQSPDPKKWALTPPAAGTSDSLFLQFPEPLDQALLMRLLRVTDAAGMPVEGVVAVEDQERRWRFTRETAWEPGEYHIVIDASLEDLAGNNLLRPFEVDLFEPIQKKLESKTVTLNFRVGR